MKKLIYLISAITFNLTIAQNINVPISDYNTIENQQNVPPPPSFGADGPGAPVPASPIDAYTPFLVAIGGILIVAFRNKIFNYQNSEIKEDTTSDEDSQLLLNKESLKS